MHLDSTEQYSTNETLIKAVCNWKLLLVIGISLYVMIISFNRHSDTLGFYKHLDGKSLTNSSLKNLNITCADSILNWCNENQMNLSMCSWRLGTFRSHFYTMAALINPPYPDSMNNSTGLALIRLGDGEMLLMFGVPIQSIDPWSWRGGPSRLGQDLIKALKYPKYQYNKFSPVYYGIYDAKNICPFHELMTMIYQHPKYLTYTNLFVNSNYPATKLLHKSLIKDQRKKIILIINNQTSPMKLTELKEWACEILLFPHDGPLLWENAQFREQAMGKIATVAKRYRNRLFAFSTGPLSRVLIHHAWLENPFNRYIDFGSTLDEMTKSRTTRPYQSNTELNQDPTYVISYDTNKQKFQVSSID